MSLLCGLSKLPRRVPAAQAAAAVGLKTVGTVPSAAGDLGPPYVLRVAPIRFFFPSLFTSLFTRCFIPPAPLCSPKLPASVPSLPQPGLPCSRGSAKATPGLRSPAALVLTGSPLRARAPCSEHPGQEVKGARPPCSLLDLSQQPLDPNGSKVNQSLSLERWGSGHQLQLLLLNSAFPIK